MTSHVLSIGQCTADDSHLARMLAVEADAHLDRAASGEDARALIAQRRYDLVLINRIFDGDGASGIDLIGELKSIENVPPLMLVSNYPEAQAEAVTRGALQGFGKNDLGTAEVGQRLRQVLNSTSRAGQRK